MSAETSLQPAQERDRTSSIVVGALLAFAGGYLDGFTYLGHGHVFANAMTGNVVLLGVWSVVGNWQQAVRHIPPIIAFLAGVWAAQVILLQSRKHRIAAPHLLVLIIEIAVLTFLSFVPLAFNATVFTALVAFAASMQVQTFREVEGRSYNSTFTTGNLRTLSESTFSFLFEERTAATVRVIRNFAFICTAFLLGAAAGGFCVHAFYNRALWIENAVLLLVVLHIYPIRRATQRLNS